MKRITYLTTSARRCLTAVVLLFIGFLPMVGNTSTYYYTADVAVASGEGTVYISNGQESGSSVSGSGTVVNSSSASTTLNLYATPNDGSYFEKWEYRQGNSGRWTTLTTNIEDQNYSTSISFNGSQVSPTAYHFRASFWEPEAAVKVAIAEEGRGTVSISKQKNKIGDYITLYAYPDAANGIHFLGWNKDKNDTENFIDTQTPYGFTITTESEGMYYAHFSPAQEKIYCRIRNRATKRFLTLYGNQYRGVHTRTRSGRTIDDGFKFDNSLKLISETDALGNPMTVFLRSGNPAGSGITNKVNLVANDIGYNNLLHEGATTNHYPLTMDATDNNKGVRIYTIFNTTYDGDDLTFETYLTDEGGDYAVMQSDESNNIYWDVYLLDEENNTYGSFGANAKSDFSGNGTYGDNGKYYTTMYTYFPYQLLDGVNAYYLPLAQSSYTEKTKTVHFTQITNGDDPVVVPMKSAVVLECTDPYNDHNNRLLPLMPEQNPNALPGTNLLNGYISISVNGEEPNKIENSDTRFILSKIDGKLGWYYFTADYMTPNKAFLDLSPWEEYYHKREAEARTIKFKFGSDDESGEATGVIAPKYAEEVDVPLFDLNGRRVTNGDAYGLKKGVYISNGKKIVVK